MNKKTFSIEIAGRTLTAEFNDLATHANGSVLLRYGETVILATAVMSKRESTAQYFPLSVEFEEKFYSAGKILGSRFQRREGRPSDEAVLSARIIDRTIRPLFDQRIRRDIQIVITVLALGEDDPDILGVLGASLALSVSDIPWAGPVSAVRLGRAVEGGAVLENPTYNQRADGVLDMELIACGKDGNINMIETTATELSESAVLDLFSKAITIHKELEFFQAKIISEIGKKKQVVTIEEVTAATIAIFETSFAKRLYETVFSKTAGKDHIYELKEEFMAMVRQAELSEAPASHFFEEKIDEVLHTGAVENGLRADGRDMDSVRDLYAEAGGISPVLHGSGTFYRGGTHIFTALTLGGPDSTQVIDTIELQDGKKRFMHHYNFPPYSVGETGRVGGFNRRMIGHGSLAEKALLPVIPKNLEFPYTIRLVSETLSSNGSSSMGSVCASSLALMDGGVPIKRPVAGIASGVMIKGDTYVLLTDIQGPEDEFGDMDFKVAGTEVGVTAIQMDVKVSGVSLEILEQALEKARTARLEILTVMNKAIAKPRAKISERAPEIITLSIFSDQIGLVIGGGGKTINAIKDESGVEEITIEEDGTVYITGTAGTPAIAATKIRALTKIYEVGEQLEVSITRVTDFGAFARLDSHHEGLIHISEIAPFRLETMNGVLSEGEKVLVVVSKVDNGKIGLSIKQADPAFAAKRGLSAETVKVAMDVKSVKN